MPRTEVTAPFQWVHSLVHCLNFLNYISSYTIEDTLEPTIKVVRLVLWDSFSDRSHASIRKLCSLFASSNYCTALGVNITHTSIAIKILRTEKAEVVRNHNPLIP